MPLQITKTEKQALSYPGPKPWTKITQSKKDFKTTTSFTYAVMTEVLIKLYR